MWALSRSAVFSKVRCPADAACHASMAHCASSGSPEWQPLSCGEQGSSQYRRVAACAIPHQSSSASSFMALWRHSSQAYRGARRRSIPTGGTGRGGSCHAARGWRGRSRTSAPRKWPRSVSSEAEPGLQLYDASHERRGRYSEEGVIGMRAVVVEGERTQVELVKDVEEVRAQLEVRFLIDPGQVRMLGEVQVGLEEPRAPEGVAADARRAAGLDIEVSRATLREVTTGHERSVRLAIAGASEILRGPNGPQRRPAGRLDRLPDHGRPWKAGVPGDDRRKFPSAQDFGQNTPLLPEGSGDIPDRRGGDLVAHVVIRGAPVQAVVLGPRLVGNETGSLKGRIVEAPGPAVIKDELEAMVHGAAERQDAGAIVGVVVRHGEIDRVERRVVGIEKVLIHQTDDVMALAAGVSEVGRKLPR